METAEAPIAPPVVAEPQPAAPVASVEQPHAAGLVDKLKSFVGSLNPMKQVDESQRQVDLARDPSS